MQDGWTLTGYHPPLSSQSIGNWIFSKSIYHTIYQVRLRVDTNKVLMMYLFLTVGDAGCRMSLSQRCLHFSCPKMSDRLLYQSEAEQLVPERSLVFVEPEVLFSVFLGISGIQGRGREYQITNGARRRMSAFSD